jgi:hypothetical protein
MPLSVTSSTDQAPLKLPPSRAAAGIVTGEDRPAPSARTTTNLDMQHPSADQCPPEAEPLSGATTSQADEQVRMHTSYPPKRQDYDARCNHLLTSIAKPA